MPDGSRPSSKTYGTAALLFFFSGGVALVYEAVWQRQFALLFGSAAPATAAVLSGYFAGLGAGAFIVGRLAARWRRPLRVYSMLELAVGLGAVLVAPLLDCFQQFYPWLFQSFSVRPELFLVLRIVAVFVVILVPTFCMGGTLPLLGAFVDGGKNHLGRTAGWLYVVNTAGAALGVLSFPFLLLPQLGITKTVWLCASVNGALAIAAWMLDRRTDGDLNYSRAVDPEPKKQRGSSKHTPVPAVQPCVSLLAFISGAVTFALQVLWNRAFAQIHENSIHSFSLIVAVIIFSLALGGQLARMGLHRGLNLRHLVGGAWIAGGVAVMAGPWLFLKLSDDLSYLPGSGDSTGPGFHLVIIACAVLLAPMTLLGLALPVILEQAGRLVPANSAGVIGRLLTVNIFGSVVGALVAGFFLPRWFGLWTSVAWLGALVFAAGLWHWPDWTNHRQQLKFGFVLVAGWLVVLWPASHLHLDRVSVAADRGEKLRSISEGAYGITAVVERPGSRRLKLNNHYGLGGTASTGDERMQAHIPLVLHPAPRRVAFLGLGTGITAGAASFHPVEQITVVELVPEVITASREYFHDANAGILEDKKTRVVTDDARNFMRGSREKFDVIIGDLVVPWRQGEGSLFTLEQFRAARESLAPHGIFCQWLPLFQLSEVEVNILTRTFLTVFPRAQVWRGDFSPTEPAIALIGSTDEFKLDSGQIRLRLAEMKADAANPQLHSSDTFWMNWVGVLELADLPPGETRLNREDQPWVELLGSALHAGGDQNSLFTGRRLQEWLDRINSRSRDKIAMVEERDRTAVEAGRVLAEMTLCVAEDNREGAHAAQHKLQQMLPPETFRLLFQ